MGLSVGGLSAYPGMQMVRPMNYALSNNSQVSDVFEGQSTRNTKGVNATNPVQYPNASSDGSSNSATSVDKLADVKKANSQYNEVAAAFGGNITGYDSQSNAMSYGMVGSTIDLYV